MARSGTLERFGSLTASLGARQWRLLGALALEQGLTRGVLARLSGLEAPYGRDAGPKALAVELDGWLQASLGSGLLIAAGATRVASLTTAPTREPGYAVHGELRQLVLRELASRKQLLEIALATHEILGPRSVGDLWLMLQEGDLKQFLRRFSVERMPRHVTLRSAAEWLRASVCEPFDAEVLERTWKSQALSIATRVLAESLDAASPCGELYEWLRAELPALEPGDARATLEALLCEHALSQKSAGALGELTAHLPRATGLGYTAVQRFQQGDLAGARLLLDEAFELEADADASAGAGKKAKRAALPHCGAVAPVLGLLLLSYDTPEAKATAKRLLAIGTSEAARGAGRAFRTLLRYLEQPEAEHARIDVHQLEAQAGVWETLLTALTVHLHLQQPATRARWSQHLVRKAGEWHGAGYLWLAKQGLLLAEELSAEHARHELERQGLRPELLQLEARELGLWDLVAPKPEWQKALQALEDVSEAVSENVDLARRVVWFVEMTDGKLSRPALQEYRLQGGWSQGRRLSLAELYEHRHGLPPEDARVLDCTRAVAEGRREPTPEAYEMLIGHPRVVNGARPSAAVDVVRGSCRVETAEEGGYIRVLVEPEGAEVGINVVPRDEGRLVVYRVSEAMQRVMRVLPHGVRVPKAHEPEVVRVLAKLAQSVEVRSPQLGVERSVEADATPCLRVAPHAGAWLVQAGVRPFGGRGRFFVAGVGRHSVGLSEAGQRLRCERDFELERRRVRALVTTCPTLALAPEEQEVQRSPHELDNWVLGEESLLALLSELRASGLAHELEWPESPALNLRGMATSKGLQGRLRSDKGWYLATGGVRLDDITEVALEELVRAPALAGGRFVRLPSGDYVELEQRIRRVLAALASGASGPRGKHGARELRIHPAATATLRELSESEGGFELDGGTRGWLERVDQLSREEFAVPAELRAELRSYQVEGFRWLCRLTELGLGACLADDMGLGKTVQILALLVRRAALGPAIVIAPTSVCTNWALEIKRFAPSLTPVEYAGDARDSGLAKLAESGAGKVLICSYALLQQDQAKLTEIEWGTAVLDEAQFIKNAQSLRAQAAFRLSARQRIAATGTPVENHAGDLWSIFQFINPGLLGDWTDFNRRFVKPIERDGSLAPEELLRRAVQPYVLRRLKRDVLQELPPITEVQHEVHLSKDEAMRYGVLRKQIHEKLFTSHGKRENKIEVLAELMRLRRFCCHPRLVFPEADTESAKISTFLELVLELRENQHRALVFSQFVDFLGLVREQLEERGVSYEYLDGSTPQAQRQARVEAFQNGSASLFLISLKAGGFGLNLTAADYVIHLDPWWNPAVEAQATDRAHRIGQERPVTVYRLITKNTIEEKIVELHAKKQRLARSLLDGGELAAQLSAQDLVRLIEGDAPGAA